MAQPLSTMVTIINNAATKYGVPPDILLGVFGMETGFGNNVTTSSAGAMGDMQFIPSTAAEYGYPMTNTPTPTQTQQQFNAAAAKLAHDAGPSKDWAQAIKAYGGGYTLKQVQDKAKSALGTSGAAQYFGGASSNLPSIPNPVTGVAGAISGLGTSITQAYQSAVSSAKYAAVLIGALVVGAVMILRSFSSGDAGRRPMVVPV